MLFVTIQRCKYKEKPRAIQNKFSDCRGVNHITGYRLFDLSITPVPFRILLQRLTELLLPEIGPEHIRE